MEEEKTRSREGKEQVSVCYLNSELHTGVVLLFHPCLRSIQGTAAEFLLPVVTVLLISKKD